MAHLFVVEENDRRAAVARGRFAQGQPLFAGGARGV